MGNNHQSRRTGLIKKISYTAAVLMLCFGFICYMFLDMRQLIPFFFLGYGILCIASTWAHKFHNNINITYHVNIGLAVLGTFVVSLFSGGISSPFSFIYATIVLAGYTSIKNKGKFYLYVCLGAITLLYFVGRLNLSWVHNKVPTDKQDLFALLCVLLTVFLVGDVFGKNLLRAHTAIINSKIKIQRQVREKETLLREIHHRVKNNLQTVSSLLNLQSRSLTEPSFKSLIKSSQNRVVSMAMVHEMLYMRNDYLSKVEYGPYAQELAEYLIRSVKGPHNNIQLEVDIPDIKLGIDTAIPLGLLINEAITNSLKYGLQDEKGDQIYIAMEHVEGNNYLLKIGDNGTGYEQAAPLKEYNSLGLKLIHNLARQLKGSITKDSQHKGTHYRIEFQDVKQDFNAIT